MNYIANILLIKPSAIKCILFLTSGFLSCIVIEIIIKRNLKKKGKEKEFPYKKLFFLSHKMYAHNTKIYTRHQVPISSDNPKGFKYVEISREEYRKLDHLKFHPFSMCPKKIADNPNKNIKKSNNMKSITRSKLHNLEQSPCCNVHLRFYTHVYRSFKDESNGSTYYIKIFRIICNKCKMTFTVLPYFLNPHKIMTAIVIYTAIKDYIIKEDADTLVFKVIQKRWYTQFFQAATDYIFEYRLSLLQILEILSANNFYAPSKHLSFYQEKEYFNFCSL